MKIEDLDEVAEVVIAARANGGSKVLKSKTRTYFLSMIKDFHATSSVKANCPILCIAYSNSDIHKPLTHSGIRANITHIAEIK